MSRLSVICLLTLLVSSGVGQVTADDPYRKDRERLVEEVLRPNGITDQRVVDAVLTTPRHEFIPENLRAQAYYDRALPIGSEQTISSPFIVAFMTQALAPQPTDVVLEIGTGSGYQAAILSPLVKHVFTMEIVDALGQSAKRTLQRLRFKNVSVRVGDGFLGWPEASPFDKIIVTCSPEQVPQPLLDQLREGGRMIIPVGERYQQMLHLLEKRNGKLELISKQPTLFVPMTGAAEKQRQVLPDGSRPTLINGDFEAIEDAADAPQISGWYYGRAVRIADGESVTGKRYVRFENDISGRPSVLLQGFAVDGRQVARLRLSAMVRTLDIGAGLGAEELPLVSITFYDEQRREANAYWLGPFRTQLVWKEFSDTFVVPPSAREAIIRIGLFGATGRADFDDLRASAVE